jgi:hypothetical protein
LVSGTEKQNLSTLINEYEYALTSHNIYDANTCKFALQIRMNTQDELLLYKDSLEVLIYKEFAKFLFIKNHIVNLELIFNNFMEENNIWFEYTIFNQVVEAQKLQNKSNIETPYIIKHDTYLPILKGDFLISDFEYKSYQLFFDINMVIKL